MRLLYAFVSWGIVALGTVHMLATLYLFKTLTSAALWFFSGGIAMALTGAINLLNRAYGLSAPGIRAVSIVANIIMLAFATVSGVITGASIAEFMLVLGLVGGAAVLSPSRRALTRPANFTESV